RCFELLLDPDYHQQVCVEIFNVEFDSDDFLQAFEVLSYGPRKGDTTLTLWILFIPIRSHAHYAAILSTSAVPRTESHIFTAIPVEPSISSANPGGSSCWKNSKRKSNREIGFFRKNPRKSSNFNS